MIQKLGHWAFAGQAGRVCESGHGGRVRAPSYGPKAFKSRIAEIQDDTFNVGSTKFVAQFQKSRESTAYYVQGTIGGEEGYYVAQEIRTGVKAMVLLPLVLAANAAEDDRTLCQVAV